MKYNFDKTQYKLFTDIFNKTLSNICHFFVLFLQQVIYKTDAFVKVSVVLTTLNCDPSISVQTDKYMSDALSKTIQKITSDSLSKTIQNYTKSFF